MQHKTLKLSALAVLVAGATGANAAVYRVVEVTDGSQISSQDYYTGLSSQINQRVEFYAKGITATTTETSDNCFETECSDEEFNIFGESRFGSDGINYRDETAFILDNLQRINDVRRLENYCNSYLGPNTCDDWARTQYYGKGYNTSNFGDRSGFGGLVREQEAWDIDKGFFSNATAISTTSDTTAFTEIETFADSEGGYDSAVVTALGSIVDSENFATPAYHKTTNSVVNAQGASDLGEYTLGISSGAYFTDGSRNARQFNKRGFVNLGEGQFGLGPVAGDELTKRAGQSLAWDAVEYNNQLLVVGSASYARSNFKDSDNKVPDDYNTNDPIFSTGAFENCPNIFGSGDATGLSNFYGSKECQLSVFANDGVFWTFGDTNTLTAQRLATNELAALDPDENDRSFQASARAIAIDNVSKRPVVAGYTTTRYDNDYYAMQAAVWELPEGTTNVSAESFTRKIIPGLELESGGDRVLTYTLATDINANNKVVGVAKNFRAENRSYAERMFVYDNSTGANAQYLDTSISPLFFTGSNGFPAAINKNNQIVGRLDAESVNQVNGRFRRQRAFTYAMGDIPGSAALKQGDVYFLDDLTNDDVTKSENGQPVANEFRIFEATGINDAGVISATAYKCSGGYDDLSKESFCQGGEPDVERIVAVKLIPIAGDEASIQPRPTAESSVERQGASLGMLALGFLGLLGFRRRK